ncbi:MAG: methyltransferase domain-containing protein [Opitutales bacterium]|nr:methyltransferase domain-containing protein [Opitutales bacterium]
MKTRESGMPDQTWWESFFDRDAVMRLFLGPYGCDGDAVEFGSGYGTFSIPAARLTKGTLHALDIEPELVDGLHQRAVSLGIRNIHPTIRDFVKDGTGLRSQSQSHAMIYNLLHMENPIGLLKEAWRVLRSGGTLSVMHWRSDIVTPRGPSLDIRPSPTQCAEWMGEAGFSQIQPIDITEACPYHFGITGTR